MDLAVDEDLVHSVLDGVGGSITEPTRVALENFGSVLIVEAWGRGKGDDGIGRRRVARFLVAVGPRGGVVGALGHGGERRGWRQGR
jgi:hypothetical protein